MSSARRGSKELTDSCRHIKTVTTETAGLQRDACEACGHVSVRFLFDVFEEMVDQIEFSLTRPDPNFPA